MKESVYIINDGELKRKNNTLYFDNKEESKYIPVNDIEELYILGEVTISKKALELCTKQHIILHFYNYHDYYVGSYYPREHYNSGYMVLKQAEYYLDIDKRRILAEKFIVGSAKNILQVLKYYKSRGKKLEEIINKINEYLSQLEAMDNIEQMMAIEGNIRETYYKAFDIILESEVFGFDKRTKRLPQNRLNSLISFGNTLLYTLVLSEIYHTHLDPRIGYLHSTNNRRFTLNLDVAEIFKPILVDRLILTLISKKMLCAKHFDVRPEGVLLNEEGKKIYIEKWNEKLKTTIKHKKLNREVSYKTLIRMELYKLQKHCMGEEEYGPYKSNW